MLTGCLFMLVYGSDPLLAANVTLAWNSNSDPIVAGYNIYYGRACKGYTNKACLGKATTVTISNLVVGATYFFAATTYSTAGAESALSGEVAYTVPAPVAGLQLGINPQKQFILTVNGLADHEYDIQATQDFKTWTCIGTVTLGSGGSLSFNDTNAANYPTRFYRIHENKQ